MQAHLFSTLFLPATLVIIMMGIGLSITTMDLRNIVSEPRNLVVGLASQLFLLPAIAFLIASLSNIRPEFKVGLIIVSACPGGVTSNLVNYIIRGNVALCVSITVVNGILTLITIPLIVRLALRIYMGQDTEIVLPVLDTITKIFIITVIPASFGIYIRRKREKLALKIQNPLRIILPLLLLGVYAGVVFLEGNGEAGLDSHFFRLIPYALMLNFFSMTAGLLVPKLFRLTKQNQYTIAVEVGLQNSTLAIFVASTLLGSQEMALVAVVYGSFSFFTTMLFGYLARIWF
jgi:BASS family bile acid:Na+ symporter